MYCFRDWREPEWIEVCTTCFQGFCPEHFSFHMATHSIHKCCVRASVKTIHIEEKDEADRTANKKNKKPVVEIPQPSAILDYTFIPYCYECQLQLSLENDKVIQYVKDSAEVSKLLAVSASWSEQVKPCRHIESLQQLPEPQPLNDEPTCFHCDKADNLWLCLGCGEVGCGRRQFDGSGGNGHAAEHYASTKHPCSIKLGTINKNAAPDVHCYECDEMVFDGRLEEHLNKFKVDHAKIGSEKGMLELQWEQNQNFDFSMATDDGQRFEPAVGFPGISNLGNSCYLSAVLQSLVRIIDTFKPHDITLCSKEPKDCVKCQFEKIKNSMIKESGPKIKPWMFKQLVSAGHSEFSSSRQQDAAEFLVYLLKTFDCYEPFSFELQQTITCLGCGRKSASTTRSDLLQTNASADACDLEQLVDQFFLEEAVESTCTQCGNNGMLKKFGLINGPKECLVVVIGRSSLKNMTPIKIDAPIKLPNTLDLSKFLEEPMPFVPDQCSVEQLVGMGFTLEQSISALKETDNSFEEALNSLLTGRVDNDAMVGEEEEEEDMAILMSMGFHQELVRKALQKTKNREAACELLMTNPESLSEDHRSSADKEKERTTKYSLQGFISHKGPSLHCGHYIAHVKVGADKWVLFNDEKAVLIPDATALDTSHAYITFYKAI